MVDIMLLRFPSLKYTKKRVGGRGSAPQDPLDKFRSRGGEDGGMGRRLKKRGNGQKDRREQGNYEKWKDKRR